MEISVCLLNHLRTNPFSDKDFQKAFPTIPIKTVDERYTSKLASQAMLEMGLKKKQRRNKAMIDEIAATMMLQEWLNKN